MDPLIGPVTVLAVEVPDPTGEAVHSRLMQSLRCPYIYPVSCDGEAVDGIAVLSQVGDQIAAYVPGLITHLSQDLPDLGAEEIKGGVYHPAGLAARLWLLHETPDAHILIHPRYAVR